MRTVHDGRIYHHGSLLDFTPGMTRPHANNLPMIKQHSSPSSRTSLAMTFGRHVHHHVRRPIEFLLRDSIPVVLEHAGAQSLQTAFVFSCIYCPQFKNASTYISSPGKMLRTPKIATHGCSSTGFSVRHVTARICLAVKARKKTFRERKGKEWKMEGIDITRFVWSMPNLQAEI